MLEFTTSKINNIENSVSKTKHQQISFKAKDAKALERVPQADTLEKKNKTGQTISIIAGIIAATAVVIGGVCYHKGKPAKGETKKFINCIKDGWKELFGKGKKTSLPSTEESSNISQIKEFSLVDFKKNGKFVKGKALLNDGTNFSGEIINTKKDGTKIIMEYENGVIKQSTKFKGEKVEWVKEYKLDNELLQITKSDESYLIYDTKNKRIIERNGLEYTYNQEGKLQLLTERRGNLNTLFYPDGKTVRCKKSSTIPGQYIFYDKTGKEIAAIHRDSGKGELGDWVRRKISYSAKDLSIAFEEREVHDLIPELRTRTLINNVRFKNTSSETYTNLESSKTFVNSKPSLFVREGDFDVGTSNRVSFYLDDTKRFIDITKGKNSARLNKTTGEIENIEGTWSKEEIDKILSDYKTRTKEQLSLARQAMKDYAEYSAELRKYGMVL